MRRLTVHSSRSRFAARLNSGVMRGPAIVGCGALRHLLPLQLEPARFIAKPASQATRRAADSIEPIGASCGASPSAGSCSAALCPGCHWVIPVHQLIRAKIALAARLRRFSALHNNSFKPKPLRGSA